MSDAYAERIARIAKSPAVQALVDTAPPLTRQQLDTVRAACASATDRFYAREGVPVAAGGATAESGALSAVAPVPSCGNSPRGHRSLGLLFCGNPCEVPVPQPEHGQVPAQQLLARMPDDADLHAVPLHELVRARQLPVLAELALPDPVLEAVGDD